MTEVSERHRYLT